MKKIAKFQLDIELLSNQLDKLLKVMNHSDPSAAEIKQLLYKKYQRNMLVLSKRIRQEFTWDVFKDYLTNLAHEIDINNDNDNKEVISKKLLKDFEGEFIIKHVLTEFSPPDASSVERKVKERESRKEANEKKQKKPKKYDRESILDMVKMTSRQRKARSQLQKIIDAINRLDPQKLEKKIMMHSTLKGKV